MHKYKILRINSVSSIANMYFDKFNLIDKNYSDQIKILIEENFIHPASWSNIFESLDVSSFDIVPNFESLQKKWLQNFYSEITQPNPKITGPKVSYAKPHKSEPHHILLKADPNNIYSF